MSLSKMFSLSALSLGLLVVWSGYAQATLIGDSVHGRFLFPNTATVAVDGGTKTIANGTTFDFSAFSVTVLFTDTQIFVTNTSPGQFSPTAFDGIDLAFLSGPAITSVTEDASSSPLFAPGSTLTFASNDIRLDVGGTCAACVGGEQIILDVNTPAAVPEPASMALLGAGLLGLGLTARRRNAA